MENSQKLIREYLTEKRKQEFDIIDDSTHLVTLVIVKNGVKFQAGVSKINVKNFRVWYNSTMFEIQRKIAEFETRKIEKRKCLQMTYEYFVELYKFVADKAYNKQGGVFLAPIKLLPFNGFFPIKNRDPNGILFYYDKVLDKIKSDTFPQFDFSTVDMIRQYVDLYQLPKQGLFFEHCNIDNLILLFFENYLEIWSKDDVRIEKSENVIRVIT